MNQHARQLPSPLEGEGLGERGHAARPVNFARQMRHAPTPWEHEVWQELRAKRFAGIKFKRQQPIGTYIVDFVALTQKLVIELDGSQHANSAPYDAKRDAFLSRAGYVVCRIWNNEWATNREGVLEEIWRLIHRPPLPNPSPSRGEGHAL